MVNIKMMLFSLFFLTLSFGQNKVEKSHQKLEISTELNVEKLKETVKKEIENNQAKFIVFGISDMLTKEHVNFTEKYGIGFYRETCAIYPTLEQKAKITNALIAAHLQSKFGDAWRSNLPETPFGISPKGIN
jgi:hypothetical protein